MSEVFVVAPGGCTSDGSASLHQLCDALNAQGLKAWMTYAPLSLDFEVPAPFRHYRASPADLRWIKPGSTVVIPEECASLIPQFFDCSVYCWWSDLTSTAASAIRRRSLVPLGPLRPRRSLAELLRAPHVRHLWRSEFARDFCADHLLTPATRLNDPVPEEYAQAATEPRRAREDLVTFDSRHERRWRGVLHTVRRTGLRVEAVCVDDPESEFDLLTRAKVHLEYGAPSHGNLLTRKAVAAGACVVTTTPPGPSADRSVPAGFAIAERGRTFDRHVAATTVNAVTDFDRLAPSFDEFRRAVATEPVNFRSAAASIFGALTH